MKLSLSPSAIKSFFINHTEKVIFFAVALSLLYFIFNAFNQDVLKIRPEQIRQKVDDAKQYLANSKPAEVPPRARPKWPEIARREIPDDIYEQDKPLNPRDYPERKDDADPVLLAILRLEGQALVGPMAVNGPGVEAADEAAGDADAAPAPKPVEEDADGAGVPLDDGDPAPRKPAAAGKRIPLTPGTYGGVRPTGDFGYEGRRMIVLTGLIPVQAQIEEYQKAFTGKAPRPRREQNEPVYGIFRIERREISPDGVASAWNKGFVRWTTLDSIKQAHAELNLNSVEDLSADWAGKAPPVLSSRFHDPLLTSPLPPMLLTDWGANATHPEIPLARVDAPPPNRDAPPTEGEPDRKPFNPELAFRTIAVPRGGAPRAAAEETETAEVREPPVQYKLFRFIDFRVKPNHKYQYRVIAYVKNPNYDINAKYLANDKQAAFRLSPMSKDSAIISVPSDRRIFSGRVAIDEDDGPVATTVVVRWMNEQGTDIISEYRKTPRGAMLDQPASRYRIDPRPPAAYVEVPRAPTDLRELSQGVMTVDARGGQPVNENLKDTFNPGEVLMLTPDGELILRRQTDDAKEVQQRSVLPTAPREVEVDPKTAPEKDSTKPKVKIVGGGGKRPEKKEPNRGVPLD